MKLRDSILSCVVEIVEDGGAGEAASTGPSVVSFAGLGRHYSRQDET